MCSSPPAAPSPRATSSASPACRAISTGCVDHEYAKGTPYGQRIAHGLLVLSVLSGLTTQSGGYRRLEPHVLALIDLHCRFPKPTFIGDTIFVRVTVAERTANHRPADKVVFRREAINQRGEVVAQADFAMLMRPMESQA